MNTSYAELEKYLYAKERIRRTPSLMHVQQGYSALVQFLHNTNSTTKYIHVVGTNGKGSTSTFLSSLAKEHGFSTLLFTSPHLVCMRERIRINGMLCSEDSWVEASRVVGQCCETEELLFFEYILLIAVYMAYEYSVDFAIIEAGLGGKFDATRILPYSGQCFTRIDYDHEHILGTTLEAIAEQKAGAINTSAILISTPQHYVVSEVLNVISKGKMQYSTGICTYELGLSGVHQAFNANLACTMWNEICSAFHMEIQDTAIQKALRNAYIPGRLQMVHINGIKQPFLLDGAHNISSLEALKVYCSSLPISGVIYSTLRRHSMAEMVQIVERIIGNAYCVYYTLPNTRALSFAEMQRYTSLRMDSVNSIVQAVASIEAHSSEGITLVFGSLYLLGEFFTAYPYTME